MNETVPTRRWIELPGLASTYSVLIVPGGSAAEQKVGAPAGLSHLVEHILYRQNELAGHPLDQLGGRVGLLTRAESMYAELTFRPEAAREACDLVSSWWNDLKPRRSIVEEEVAVVIDEVSQANRQPFRRYWQFLVEALFDTGPLRGHLGGEADVLLGVSPSQLRDYQHAIRDLGTFCLAIGPADPWVGEKQEDAAPWIPPASTPTRESKQIVRDVRGLGHCIVGCGRVVPGIRSSRVLGAYAAFAAIEFGRVHPVQHEFHVNMRFRHLNPVLCTFADAGVFAVTARCHVSQADRVTALLEQLMEEPTAGSSPERIYRCALHHVGELYDNVCRRAEEDATRLLHGAPELRVVLDELRCAVPEEVFGTARSCFLGPPISVLLLDEGQASTR